MEFCVGIAFHSAEFRGNFMMNSAEYSGIQVDFLHGIQCRIRRCHVSGKIKHGGEGVETS
jgi:hypothetical protein